MGQREASRFNAETKTDRVSIERFAIGRGLKELELVRVKDALMHLPGFLTRAHELDRVPEGSDEEDLNRLR